MPKKDRKDVHTIITYENRKSDPIILDANTPEQRAAAFLWLFRYLGSEWDVYTELDKREKLLYDKAEAGDAAAAEKLLTLRQSYEYEAWSFGELIDPLKD